MKLDRIVQAVSALVTVVGLLVIVGWVFDVPALKSIFPGWVTMKFSTALAFVLSGVTLYAMFLSTRDSELALLILPISSLLIMLLMLTLLASVLIGAKSGIEDLFVKEGRIAVQTTVPGRPSILTMVEFILISLLGLNAALKSKWLTASFRWGGGLIAGIGMLAVLGYVFSVPTLYFYVPGVSTAMALHTALLFGCIGMAMLLMGRGPRSEKKDL